MAKKRYKINPQYIDKALYTVKPTYERKDKGKFVLDANLSQKDMGYLYEVMKYTQIISVESPEPNAETNE